MLRYEHAVFNFSVNILTIKWYITIKTNNFQDELDAICEKLAKLEAPSVNSAAKANANGVYSRLTDHKKYTGAHKERFNEDGTGKGKSGREEVKDGSGYVAAYKHKDTYDEVHGKH